MIIMQWCYFLLPQTRPITLLANTSPSLISCWMHMMLNFLYKKLGAVQPITLPHLKKCQNKKGKIHSKKGKIKKKHAYQGACSPLLEYQQQMREVALARTGCCHRQAPSSCDNFLQVNANASLSCPQSFQPCLQVSQGLCVHNPSSWAEIAMIMPWLVAEFNVNDRQILISFF